VAARAAVAKDKARAAKAKQQARIAAAKEKARAAKQREQDKLRKTKEAAAAKVSKAQAIEREKGRKLREQAKSAAVRQRSRAQAKKKAARARKQVREQQQRERALTRAKEARQRDKQRELDKKEREAERTKKERDLADARKAEREQLAEEKRLEKARIQAERLTARQKKVAARIQERKKKAAERAAKRAAKKAEAKKAAVAPKLEEVDERELEQTAVEPEDTAAEGIAAQPDADEELELEDIEVSSEAEGTDVMLDGADGELLAEIGDKLDNHEADRLRAKQLRKSLRDLDDPAAAPSIMALFRADGDPFSLRSHLLLALERMAERVYFAAFLDAIPRLYDEAPQWAFSAMLRLLNTRGSADDSAVRFESAVLAAGGEIPGYVIDLLIEGAVDLPPEITKVVAQAITNLGGDPKELP
jgi:hypothetical protein